MDTFLFGMHESDWQASLAYEAIELAKKQALWRRANEVASEHLLLGLIEQSDSSVINALDHAGIDARAIKLRAQQMFGERTDSILDGIQRPLSKELQGCLDWAFSLVDSLQLTAESISPALLMASILRLQRMQMFLLPLLPTLDTMFIALMGSAVTASVFIEFSSSLQGSLLAEPVPVSSTFQFAAGKQNFATMKDFVQARMHAQERTRSVVCFCQGSTTCLLKSMIRPNPAETFDDLVGLDEIKRGLQRSITFLTSMPEFQQEKSPPGILVVGPAHNQRNVLVRAIAGQASVPLIEFSCYGLVQMLACIHSDQRSLEELGLPEREYTLLKHSEAVAMGSNLVADVFCEAKKESPCLLFLNGLDTLAQMEAGDAYRRLVHQLCVEIEDIDEELQVVVVATASDLAVIDRLLLAPRCFGQALLLPMTETEDASVDPWTAMGAFEQREDEELLCLSCQRTVASFWKHCVHCGALLE